MLFFANMIQSFDPVLTNLYKAYKLPFFDTSYEGLTLNIAITVAPNFLDHTPKEFKSMPSATTNNLFMNLIYYFYFSSTIYLVLADGSVTSSRMGFAFLIFNQFNTFNHPLTVFLTVLPLLLKVVIYLGLQFVLALFHRVNT